MSNKKNVSSGRTLLDTARNHAVPIMFIIICAIFIPMAGFSPSYLLNEIITRMGRNLFLVLCLLFPIMAGMGLNCHDPGGHGGGDRRYPGGRLADLGHPRGGAGHDSVHPLLRLPGLYLWNPPEYGQGPGDDYQLYYELLHRRLVSVCRALCDGFRRPHYTRQHHAAPGLRHPEHRQPAAHAPVSGRSAGRPDRGA